MDAKDKVINYFIKESACDICGKCVHYVEPKEDEDYTPCPAYEKSGKTACRKGMIEYFSKSKNEQAN